MRQRTALAFILFSALMPTCAYSQITRKEFSSGDYCGARALFLAQVSLQGSNNSLADLLKLLGKPPVGGYSLGELAKAGEALGLYCYPVQINEAGLKKICSSAGLRAIIRVSGSHFSLVTWSKTTQRFEVIDPPNVRYLGEKEIGTKWDGYSLVVSSSPVELNEFLATRNDLNRILAALSFTIACVVFYAVKRKYFSVRSWLPFMLFVPLVCGCNSRESGPQSAIVEPESEKINSPQIQLSQTTFDFGDITRTNSEIAPEPHRIEISNAGGTVLEIKSVATSCGCAVVQLPESTVPPGKSVWVDLKLEKSEIKAHSANLDFHTNDPVTPVARILILWNVTGVITPSETTLDLQRLEPGEKVERKVTLKSAKNFAQGIYALRKVTHEPSYENVEINWHAGSGDILVKVSGGQEIGQFATTIFGCDEKGERLFNIGLAWHQSPVLVATPARLINRGNDEKRIVLRCYDDESSLEDVTVQCGDGVTVQWSKLNRDLAMGKLIFSEGASAGKSLVTFRVGKHEATIEIVAPAD